MAKKTKNKKKNLQKRQEDKKKKRIKALQTKKNRKPSKVSSVQRRLMENMPFLSLEPEVEAIRPDEALIRTAMEQGGPREQVLAFATPDLLREIEEAMAGIQIRIPADVDAIVNLSAKTMETALQQSDATEMAFPFLACKFVIERQKILGEVPIDGESLMETVEAFLQENGGGERGVERPASEGTAGGASDEGEAEGWSDDFADSELGACCRAIEEHLERKFADKPEEAEFLQAEINTFFEEYLFETKGVSTPENLKASHFSSYLSGWYLRNAKPSREDMSVALQAFEEALARLETMDSLSAEALAEAKERISDREAFLDLVD